MTHSAELPENRSGLWASYQGDPVNNPKSVNGNVRISQVLENGDMVVHWPGAFSPSEDFTITPQQVVSLESNSGRHGAADVVWKRDPMLYAKPEVGNDLPAPAKAPEAAGHDGPVVS